MVKQIISIRKYVEDIMIPRIEKRLEISEEEALKFIRETCDNKDLANLNMYLKTKGLWKKPNNMIVQEVIVSSK